MLMPKINDTLLYLVLTLVLICTLAFGSYKAGVDNTEEEWRLKWAEQAQRLADAERAYTELARAEELRRQAAINEVTTNAQTEIDRARADAAAAHAAADSLRDQAKRLAAAAGKTCSNPSHATAGKAAGSAGLVLADVLGRVEEAGRSMAEAADRSRIAGAACEAAYDALTVK